MSCFLLHVSQSVLLNMSRIGLLPVSRSVVLILSRYLVVIMSPCVLLIVSRSVLFFFIQKCFYCRSTASGKDNGACVQCCAGKCAVSFHVTCFVLAGFALEPSDWPQPTETYCERHQRTRFKVSIFCGAEACNN